MPLPRLACSPSRVQSLQTHQPLDPLAVDCLATVLQLVAEPTAAIERILQVVRAWQRWSAILLRPQGLYGTRPADWGNKGAKLRAIREALGISKRIWLAADCDREGQLIGQEILEHYKYRGEVMRVLFTAQDQQTIRDSLVEQSPMPSSAHARSFSHSRRFDITLRSSFYQPATLTFTCAAITIRPSSYPTFHRLPP